MHLGKLYKAGSKDPELENGVAMLSPPSLSVWPGPQEWMKVKQKHPDVFSKCGWFKTYDLSLWARALFQPYFLVSWGSSLLSDSQALTSKPNTSLHT